MIQQKIKLKKYIQQLEEGFIYQYNSIILNEDDHDNQIKMIKDIWNLLKLVINPLKLKYETTFGFMRWYIDPQGFFTERGIPISDKIYLEILNLMS